MAKPRIFVSSTYYDLKHVRRQVESFIKSLNYESVLFENGDIPFHHVQPLDISCYDEVASCDIFILVIGGRYGSEESTSDKTPAAKANDSMYEFYNSITKREYSQAREKNIPIYIFVEKGVLSEYETFKKNRENTSINYAHVDSINIFKLLDEIFAQRSNNLLRAFETIEDIITWLKDQWAGLFADFLRKRSTDAQLANLQEQIGELKAISEALLVYNKALINSSDIKEKMEIISSEDLKLRFSNLLLHINSGISEYDKVVDVMLKIGFHKFEKYSTEFTPDMKQVVAIGRNVPISVIKEVIYAIEPLGVNFIRKITVPNPSENHRSFLISIGQPDQLFPTTNIDKELIEKLVALNESNTIDDLL